MLVRLLLVLALLLLFPVVSADSYACATGGTTGTGQTIIFHEDPLTVGVVEPLSLITQPMNSDEAATRWVGVSIYPQGNGPCLVVENPFQ